MNELIIIAEEAPEGGYTARALGPSIFTEADTLSHLHSQVRDAVRCHFEEGQAPKLIRLARIIREPASRTMRAQQNPTELAVGM